MKNIAIDKTKNGWDQVTDIPCIIPHCPGLLRWAEAGYVPGYRICDCCGSHYSLVHFSPSSGLKVARRLRPSPDKIAAMHVKRGAAAKVAAQRQSDWLRVNTMKANARWQTIGERCSHGMCVNIPWEDTDSASGCIIDEIQPPEFATIILDCWSMTRDLSALRPAARVLNATRDGKYVMVYDVTHTYGDWDGWWETAELKAAIASRTTNGFSKIDAKQKKNLNVWR